MNAPNYDTDFHAWAFRQAELLRCGELSQLDCLHLAEEIEDLGKRERWALKSRVAILLGHFLKWEYQLDDPHIASHGERPFGANAELSRSYSRKTRVRARRLQKSLPRRIQMPWTWWLPTRRCLKRTLRKTVFGLLRESCNLGGGVERIRFNLFHAEFLF